MKSSTELIQNNQSNEEVCHIRFLDFFLKFNHNSEKNGFNSINPEQPSPGVENETQEQLRNIAYWQTPNKDWNLKNKKQNPLMKSIKMFKEDMV